MSKPADNHPWKQGRRSRFRLNKYREARYEEGRAVEVSMATAEALLCGEWPNTTGEEVEVLRDSDCLSKNWGPLKFGGASRKRWT